MTAELVDWADLIFVMEKAHSRKLRSKFRPHLSSARVICLDIADDYRFMQPELVRLLERKVSPFLPLLRGLAKDGSTDGGPVGRSTDAEVD